MNECLEPLYLLATGTTALPFARTFGGLIANTDRVTPVS